MHELLKNPRKGASTITVIGIAGVILLFGLFFLELQEMFDVQYAIGVRAQRSVNSIVETCIDDAWRADGYNIMDVDQAKSLWKEYMDEDLNVDSSGNCYSDSGKLIYHVSYGTPEFFRGRVSDNEQKNQGDFAYMQVTVNVQMKAGLCKYFGINGYEWSNTYKSDNFRTDNERAGD